MGPQELGEAVARADSNADVSALALLAHPWTIDDFASRQVRALRGPSESELVERTGRRARETRAALRGYADRILASVYRVKTVEELELLHPREVFARALAERYRPLPSFRPLLHFVATVRVRDDLEYGVFESEFPGASPAPIERPGVRLPLAMTFARSAEGWYAFLDGALSVKALDVFAPGAQV